MGTLDKLEASLVDPLDKKAPVKLPPSARKSLGRAMWIIALVFGILQLWAAWSLWHLGHYVDRSVDYLNSLSAYYGGPDLVASSLGVFYYVSLIFILADAALLLFAAPGLKSMRRFGWNLLFYSLILNVAYGVIRIFAEVGGGFGPFVWSLIVSTIGAYFLFQIRDQFTGAGHQAEAKK